MFRKAIFLVVSEHFGRARRENYTRHLLRFVATIPEIKHVKPGSFSDADSKPNSSGNLNNIIKPECSLLLIAACEATIHIHYVIWYYHVQVDNEDWKD